MGWASGSYLAQDLWDIVKPHIPKAKRQAVAEKIVTQFENEDADDWDYEPGGLYHTARPGECEDNNDE